MKSFYSIGRLEAKIIINRETYGGRGRPRKKDYISAIEAQKMLNKYRNDYLNRMFIRSLSQ